jgi:hypothetical protein
MNWENARSFFAGNVLDVIVRDYALLSPERIEL